jgi:hypothetical protein
MKPPTSSFLLPAGARTAAGSALVITLAVLVLMSIMVISLSDIMRVERGSAHSHLEKARADLFAEMGTAKVIARLRRETADSKRNWISQPGQIIASDPGGSSNKLVDSPILLSSDKPDKVTATSVPAFLRPAQLNIPTFDTGTNTGTIAPHLISNQEDPNSPGNAVSMAVRWIYVRKDGTEDVSEQPALDNASNPIVGRYGYWTDDESCKVNYNLAWLRSSTNPNQAGHPTKINLPTLFDVNDLDAVAKATAIHFYQPTALQTPVAPTTITDYRNFSRFFFQTPEDARQVARLHAGVDTALLAAKFNVTHYNHDPDTTFFNEPRIVLTTQPERAGWTYKNGQWVGTNGKPWPNGLPTFINVGAVDPTSPTRHPYTNIWDPISKVDPTKLADVIDKLNSYLQRTDWPIASPIGSSFQAKYYAGKAERLTQLSLNIVNYVRTKESTGDPPATVEAIGRGTKTVIPVRGEQLPGQRFVMMAVATSTNSYIGITRTPKITEMGLWVSGTPSSVDTKTNTYKYSARPKIEIYLPPNFGLDSLDLTQLSWFIGLSNVSGGAALQSQSPEAQITADEVTIPARPLEKGGVMLKGEYAVVTRKKNGTSNFTVSFTGPRPTSASLIGLRFAISIVNRLDVCPLGNPAVCKLDGPEVPESDISSIEVDDPRVNSYNGDWKIVNFGTGQTNNTLGKPNSTRSIGYAPGPYSPKQDLDNLGHITDISLVMPAPPGTTNANLSSNPTGVVASSGELGFIHTGMESTRGAGIPWRTLHLQPDSTQALPDWAFMDLFTVPADVPPDVAGQPSPKAIYSPHNTTTAGRVNMNAKPEPFDLDRKDPLVAVFEGAAYDANNLAGKLNRAQAKAIANAVYNRTLAQPKPTGLSGGKPYGYLNGYDSPGEVVEMAGVADGGEESEQLVREIANLITARGGVFSVYTVGQALKQTPTGALVVTGEQRQQAMIERYSDTTGVHFRPVYFRSLTP